MINKIISTVLFILFITIVLSVSIRGIMGSPSRDTLNSEQLKEEGPLELSPERGRFALTFSLIEDKSFHFSLPVARFVTPDLGYLDGRYVSLFDPGVSLLAIPGYIIGKYFGASQVGSFAIIGLFAIANALLVRMIARKLGANPIASSLAALIFLFGTPAFAYAVTLYQHHVTVFLMLLSVYLLLKWKGVLPLFFVWLLVVGSLLVDYPNFFLFLPIGVYALGRVFPIVKGNNKIKFNIKILGVVSFLTILIPLSLFLWVHKVSYGNPLQLAGNLRSVKDFDQQGNPLFKEDILRRAGQEVTETPDSGDKTAIGFFKTRNMMSSLYIHLISNERGVLWFTPVILVGIFGISHLYKKRPGFTSLLLALIGSNVFLYAMWGDFWGGWAFGSRYLIPSYAILAIFASITLTKTVSKKVLLSFIFFLLLSYSVAVNTLGALTTNSIPPKIEAVALEPISGRKEHYTYLRNWEFLMANKSKSFVYQTFAKDYLTAPQYYYIVLGSIILVMGGQTIYMYLKARRES